MIYYILSIIAIISSPVLTYSTGAPRDVCGTLEPKHGALVSQESGVPYQLELSSTSTNPGKPIDITLKGNGDNDTILGFIIQARMNGKPVGKFVPSSHSNTLGCSASDDTLTHTKILQKVNQINAQWIPNEELKGQEVQFVATVVKRADIFWVQKINKSIQVA